MRCSFLALLYFRLPVDIYQTAKVSKLLLMIEKGTVPIEYKGKSLAEIDLDVSTAYAEESDRKFVTMLSFCK